MTYIHVLGQILAADIAMFFKRVCVHFDLEIFNSVPVLQFCRVVMFPVMLLWTIN